MHIVSSAEHMWLYLQHNIPKSSTVVQSENDTETWKKESEMSQEEEEDDEEHLSRRLVMALLGSSPSQLSSGQLPPVLISTDS